MPNPFRLEVLEADGPFCDREVKLNRLRRHAESTQNVVLASPRRFGKTSLCRKLQRELEAKGYLCFAFDFSGVDSIAEIARRLAREIYRALDAKQPLLTKGKQWMGALRSFRPTVTFGPSGEAGFTITHANEVDPPATLLETTLEDLAAIVRSKKYPCHIVMDEFQDITKLNDSELVEGLLRKNIQGVPASFIFVGSRRSLLLQMFSDQKRFLTLSANKEFLPPLPEEETSQCIQDLFLAAERDIDADICRHIVTAAHQYPFYVQRLASQVYESEDDPITPATVEKAAEAVLISEQALYEVMIAPLTTGQLRLLKALARIPTNAITGKEFVSKADLPTSSIPDIRKVLTRADLIEKTDSGIWKVVDPFFAAWLRRL